MAEHVNIRVRETVETDASNSAIIGEDVLAKITLPKSWGLVFGGDHYTYSNVVWVDFTTEEARKFAKQLNDAADSAEATWEEYVRYQDEQGNS